MKLGNTDIDVYPNGNLNSSWDYVDYEVGHSYVILDGSFNAVELRLMADHLEKYGTK